ncbi:IS701 family transposase [Streptomyces chartreusis]
MSALRPVSIDAPASADQFADFADTVFAPLQRVDQRRWGRAYLLGLLTAPPGKKTVRRLAAAVTDSPTASQSLQQFVNASPWQWEPVRHELARWVEGELRPNAWTVATTVLPKRGEHSCGVHRRFVPQLGQTVNCQLGVGLFMSADVGAVPVDWRLHLPERWFRPHLRRRARIPGEARPLPMCVDIFDMVERLHRCVGVAPAPVVAELNDSRQGEDLMRLLSGRRHDFVIAVPGDFLVLPLDNYGREQSAMPLSAHHIVSLTGDLRARSAGSHLPSSAGEAAVSSCLIRLPAATQFGIRERHVFRLFADPRRSRIAWITNMTRRRTADLASLIECQARSAETVRVLERDLGLMDFEGRSYPGWHHYMTLVSAAYAYRALSNAPRRGSHAAEAVPA